MAVNVEVKPLEANAQMAAVTIIETLASHRLTADYPKIIEVCRSTQDLLQNDKLTLAVSADNFPSEFSRKTVGHFTDVSGIPVETNITLDQPTITVPDFFKELAKESGWEFALVRDASSRITEQEKIEVFLYNQLEDLVKSMCAANGYSQAETDTVVVDELQKALPDSKEVFETTDFFRDVREALRNKVLGQSGPLEK